MLSFKSYWKQYLYTLFILVALLKVRSESDLVWLLCLIFIVLFIRIELNSPRGIHKAVLDEKIDRIEKYLDKGIDIDLENNAGTTPLMLAIHHNLIDVVEFLIERGANVNRAIKDDKKATPLYVAVTRKHQEITNLLITNGAVVEPHTAAFQGNTEAIKDYLSKGGEINLKGCQEKTFLHMAAWSNQLELAKFLIDNGADVNAKDWESATPLHIAACDRDGDKLVELLIDRGAEVDVVSKSKTPLLIAARHNYVRIAKVLIEKGANVNARFGITREPLLLDTVSGHANCFEVVELLIANGVDVNAYDKFRGETALHKLAYWGHIDIARLLIANGAKVNFRDSSGNTPLSRAENGRNREMYFFLVRCGARL